MNVRSIVAGAATALAVLGGYAVTVDPPVIPVADQVYGTIRRSGSHTWDVLGAPGHTSLNIASVTVYADHLQLNYSQPMDAVGTFSVTPDETFTRYGVRCGASVSLAYAVIECYMPGSTVKVDPNTLTAAEGNLWIFGIFPRGGTT